MAYWDWNRITRIHGMMSKDYRNGAEGLKAILFLRSFFEEIKTEGFPVDHPLRNRFSVGMESNYSWLIQYAQKIMAAKSIPNFNIIACRFASPLEYFSVTCEMETALKLYLDGLDVSFCQPTSTPSPDLIININNKKVMAEVTSLRPPEEEMMIQNLVDYLLSLGFPDKVSVGGFINRVPRQETQEEIMKMARKGVEEAKTSHRMKKLNLEGKVTLYVAPTDIENKMPEDCRRSLHFNIPNRKPIEEQITRKIEDKKKQLPATAKNSNVLFIYTHTIGRNNVSQLYENSNVEAIVAAYPRLSGLILTAPHLGAEVVSAVETEELKKIAKPNKIFLESEVGAYQYESSIIWPNPHADKAFPREIIQALENYPLNLRKLKPL